MQPLGGMRDPFLDGLIVFPKDHFQSDPKVVSGKNGSFSGEGGSIIFSGDSTWSINSDVCIFPVFGEEANGLCLIPTVDSSLKLTGSKTIKPGCDGAKARIFNGQNCYGIGIHSIHVQSDFSAKTMSDVCGSGGGDDMKGKFGQLMEIWKGRVTKGIEEDEVLKYPYEGKNMVQLLYKIVGVFHEICPAVNYQYLALLKNIFILHMKVVWAKGPVEAIPSDDYWRHATLFIDSCFGHFGHGMNPLMDGSSCAPFVARPDDSDPESEVMWDMVLDHNYDTVIEQVWYMFNAITPSCNLLNEYKTNDWILMDSLLKESFFDAVSVQWEKPGHWQRLYEIMFHGFDIPKERMKILACVQHAIASTPHFDPIGRTEYFNRRAKEETVKFMKKQNHTISGGGSPSEPVSSDDGGESKNNKMEDEEKQAEEKPEEPVDEEKPSPAGGGEDEEPPPPPEEEEDTGDKTRKKRNGRAGKSSKTRRR
ncbi:uncharacterized protein LOC110843355 [Folsomia candida]|nr:uncharacterized protein LOC110843355 [Folsomia candida]